MDYFTISPPLRIGYLAAVIEREGYTVSILDALASGWDRESPEEDPELLRIGLTDAEIAAEIRNFDPDIVGITNPFTSQFNSTVKAASLIKRLNPDIKVVAGGVHPSAMPNQCIIYKDIDFVIKGEGENPMVELLLALQGKYSLSEVKGLYYKKRNGEVVFNGLGKPIKDLDEIPFPAYHLMPRDKYFAAASKDMTSRGGFTTAGRL